MTEIQWFRQTSFNMAAWWNLFTRAVGPQILSDFSISMKSQMKKNSPGNSILICTNFYQNYFARLTLQNAVWRFFLHQFSPHLIVYIWWLMRFLQFCPTLNGNKNEKKHQFYQSFTRGAHLNKCRTHFLFLTSSFVVLNRTKVSFWPLN